MPADEAEQPLLSRGAESSSSRQERVGHFEFTSESSSGHQQHSSHFELSTDSMPLLHRREEDGLFAHGADTTQWLSSDSRQFSSERPQEGGSQIQWHSESTPFFHHSGEGGLLAHGADTMQWVSSDSHQSSTERPQEGESQIQWHAESTPVLQHSGEDGLLAHSAGTTRQLSSNSHHSSLERTQKGGSQIQLHAESTPVSDRSDEDGPLAHRTDNTHQFSSDSLQSSSESTQKGGSQIQLHAESTPVLGRSDEDGLLAHRTDNTHQFSSDSYQSSSRTPKDTTRRLSSNSHHSSSERQGGSQIQWPVESTPLLHRSDEDGDGLLAYGTDATRRLSSDSHRSSSERPKKGGPRIRWPVVFSLISLATVLAVLVFAFAAPAAIRRYAEEAAVFKPTHLSIDSATSGGVRARVQGDFVVDARRIRSNAVRNLGRLATWIGREVETGETDVKVYLPEYGNVLVGTASLPSITVDVRNGHTNQINVLADLTAGNIPGIRAVAMDWLEERLGQLRVKGQAVMHLKSGLLGLGMRTISKSITFEESDFPALPDVKVHKLNVHDSAQKGAMVVDASIAALLDIPFSVKAPSLGFEVLVPNCLPGEPYISVADVRTEEVLTKPNHPTNMNVRGMIQGLSDELTKSCPGQKDSPLDLLVRSYVNGLQTTVYVRGAEKTSLGTPLWIVDLLKSVTVPLHFTGHTLDNLIKDFSMSNVHFSLPDPFAEPDSPKASPRISALVNVIVGLPKQLNLTVDIPRVRANADVFYEGRKLGVIELHKWQTANSTRILQEDGLPALFVKFNMKDVPLHVTNEDVLADIIQSLIFRGKSIQLHIAAAVDTEVATGLGEITVRGIPAEGNVSVNSLLGSSVDQLNPQIASLELGPTTDSSALMKTKVNITNPTKYSATIPMADFALLYNTTTVAHIICRNVSIVPGVNTDISVDFLWCPLDADGSDGMSAGREMISQYVSGVNTTVTVRTHRGTFPAIPKIGEALSKLGLDVQVPKLPVPRSPEGKPDGDGSQFLQYTTVLLSPHLQLYA